MTKENKVIPIFFAIDDNYIPFLCVALNSMVKKSSKKFNYNIHVLNSGLKPENKLAVSKYNKDNFKIFFNDMNESIKNLKKELPLRDYYTDAIFYRLFIADMFREYDKALYIDCDIVLNDDISKLYDIDIGNNYLGAVTDEAVTVTPPFIHYVEKCLGVKAKNYFNSGVLVLNLKILREENFKKKFLHLLAQYKFLPAPDQDYLNVLCKDKVFYISNIWNKMPIIPAKLEDLKLIHYNLSFKPWHYDGILFEELFWKSAKETEFYNKILELKNAFTDDLKAKDKKAGENLIKMTGELAIAKDSFYNLLKSGEITLL